MTILRWSAHRTHWSVTPGSRPVSAHDDAPEAAPAQV
jgi:hypothetical protein